MAMQQATTKAGLTFSFEYRTQPDPGHGWQVKPGEQIHRCFGDCGRRVFMDMRSCPNLSLFTAMKTIGWTQIQGDMYICKECLEARSEDD